MMNWVKILVVIDCLISFWGCGENVNMDEIPGKDMDAPMKPDYMNITVPVNIAPLNFMVSDSAERVLLELKGKSGILRESGERKILFEENEFKDFLAQSEGDTIWGTLAEKRDGAWIKYRSFYWVVATEKIDSWLTYRLIEPGYEVWNKLWISQRNITNFEEEVLADNNMADGACMNCHISNKHEPGSSFFHLRHPEGGGTIINQNGKLRKLKTNTNKTISSGVYGNWHPGGRFIAFSTNVIIPEFYSTHNKRMEVYDTTSDLMVLDLKTNQVFSGPAISRKGKLETFPEFSADGKRLFFCVADSVSLPEGYQSLKYSLCAVSFDAQTRTIGCEIDTVFSANENNMTVSEPKVSPDGRFLMFTGFEYGTFPIWHNEAKLFLVDLSTYEVKTLPQVNNNENYSNSYHSWSSNSRWMVFASKRDNGLYGKPYFAYIDDDGNGTKPFVLPQKDPEFYDYFYKSFNIPELFEYPNNFGKRDVEKAFNMPGEEVTFLEKTNKK